jgi:hypothetical protein
MSDQAQQDSNSAAGGASVLTEMLADHPYYCSESNYYSNEAGATWETMTDFLAGFESADEDMNLVFRWDIRQRDEDNPGRYYAEVFMMHQRKGIFSPHHIKHINEGEAIRFRAYLEKHWKVMRALWEPLSANAKCG